MKLGYSRWLGKEIGNFTLPLAIRGAGWGINMCGICVPATSNGCKRTPTFLHLIPNHTLLFSGPVLFPFHVDNAQWLLAGALFSSNALPNRCFIYDVHSEWFGAFTRRLGFDGTGSK